MNHLHSLALFNGGMLEANIEREIKREIRLHHGRRITLMSALVSLFTRKTSEKDQSGLSCATWHN